MFGYNKIDKIVGWNIRNLRKQKKWTQNDMITKLQLEGFDCSRENLAKIETGIRYVYPAELVIIKKVLNCTFEDIFEGTEKN